MLSFNTLVQYFDVVTQVLLAAGLAVFLVLERRKPRLPAQTALAGRWYTNVSLYAIGAVLIVFGFDFLGEHAIQWGGLLEWGGLAATTWPTWIKVSLGLVLMDFLHYAVHVLSHYVPWWWRLHKIHHSDNAMDASTAIRHHPIETLTNAFVVLFALAAVGMPVYAILLYALLQPLHSLFCHANLALPPAIDRWLRLLVVTPDMHATHHSIRLDEGNSNFGMVFPWWDRLFRTYCKRPAQGMAALQVGITELAQQAPPGMLGLLGLPFAASRKVRSSASKPAGRSARRKSAQGNRR
jgi:sterol desaturase/sphingolipid hydroxylase (fatty acid hydroxylase superfamily)